MKLEVTGVPEFGTKFVRGMLVDTKPTTFDELIRIDTFSEMLLKNWHTLSLLLF